jgi:hypothetical protein
LVEHRWLTWLSLLSVCVSLALRAAGAVADDGKDDTLAIRAALSDCGGPSGAGGEILLRKFHKQSAD